MQAVGGVLAVELIRFTLLRSLCMLQRRLTVAVLIEAEDALGVNCCSPPISYSSLNTLGRHRTVFRRNRLRNGLKLRVLFLVAARASSSMVATAAVYKKKTNLVRLMRHLDQD